MTRPLRTATSALTLLCALFTLDADAGPPLFVCDDPGTDLSVDSAFGAAPGVVQAFATVPQDFSIAFGPSCLSQGSTWVVGVVVQATRTGGSTTMPIAGVQITESPMLGPPSDMVITSGPGGQIENVPIFPNRTLSRIPAAPGVALLDFDNDGDLDLYVSPRVSVAGDDTFNQFIAYSRSGPSVPCFTGSLPGPVDESCTDPPSGDPALRAFGVGLASAAGAAFGPFLPTYTTNPELTGFLDFYWEVRPPANASVADLTVFDDGGQVICSMNNLPRGAPAQCALTLQEVLQWTEGQLEIEIVAPGVGPSRDHIIPADKHIFADGFESGDTTSWDVTVP